MKKTIAKFRQLFLYIRSKLLNSALFVETIREESLAKRSRRKKSPKYKSFRYGKKIKIHQDIPGGIRLFVNSVRMIFIQWKLFLPLIIIYGVVYIIIVKNGTILFGTSSVKQSFEDTIELGDGNLINNLSAAATLLSSGGAVDSDVQSVYQTLLFSAESMSIIWIVRHIYESKTTSLRSAFYSGTAQFLPFLIVVMTLIIQLLPLTIGAVLLNNASEVGALSSIYNKLIFYGLFTITLILSMYLIIGSLFGLYIVTLPNALPFRSIKASYKIVKFKRLVIVRRILTFVLLVAFLTSAIIFPLVVISPVIADIVYLVLFMLALPLMHVFFYQLYRSMI